MKKYLEAIERGVREELSRYDDLRDIDFSVRVLNDDERQPDLLVTLFLPTSVEGKREILNIELIKDIFWRVSQQYFPIVGIGFFYAERQPG